MANPAASAAVSGELGGLCLSSVLVDNPMSMVRAAQWFNALGGLGVALPYFVVHDVGLLLTHAIGQSIELKPRERSVRIARSRGTIDNTETVDKLRSEYRALLADIARSELVQTAVQRQLSDDVVAAVIAKIIEPVQGALSRGGIVRMPLTVGTYTEFEPAHVLDKAAGDAAISALDILTRARVRVRVSLEQVDLDSIKLLEMFRGDGDMGSATDMLDIYHVLVTPAVHDIVNFSLDLLPSVLETKRSEGAQTFSVDGYASIETKGNLDGLLPSELAFDDDLFDRRWADNELFYYGREKTNEERERLHYILVDASASMRGLRTVFARGLALALAKKMSLRGEDVWLRFFDSRLHERQELSASKLKIPYLLCFRSERGRNTTRVFSELERELGRLGRENPRDVVVTFITHGRCHIDPRLVENLRAQATLSGVFVMPSGGEIELEYLDRLHQHYTVDQAALSDKSARQSEALRILADR